jgi:conjugal transfer/entry exclusion protein
MVDVRQAVAGALAVVLGVSSPVSHAMPVIDAANLMQNLMAAQQAAEQVLALYEQTQLLTAQLEATHQQLKSMSPEQLLGVAADITGSAELRQVERTIAAHRDLVGSVQEVRRAFSERLDAARLMRLNWREYVAWEQARIARREEGAVARVNAEVHAMRRIEADFAFAREQAAKIAQTAGTHEAMQQMNVQMNRVVQQNAELLRQVATAFGRHTAEREMQEAEDRLQQRQRQEAYRTASEAAWAADRAAVDLLKRGVRP